MKLYSIFAAGLLVVSANAASADFVMKAGNINNHEHAKQICPKACNLTWNGHWVTKVEGQMSICSAANDMGNVIMDSTGGVEAGPIWNNADAGGKCPAALSQVKWNGHWDHTGSGIEAVCACTGNAQPWQ